MEEPLATEEAEGTVEVQEAAEPIQEVVTSTGGTILESLDAGAGSVWRVTMVRPGVSRNRRRYAAKVLAEAASLYEGAKSFDGHRDDQARRGSAIKDLVGWHENVAPGPDGSLQSDFHISESAPKVRALFLEAWKKNRPDLIGFSHDVHAITKEVMEGGLRLSDVQKITEVSSVDVVADPSAGGRIERLVAGGTDTMTATELTALLAENPELAEAARAALSVPDAPAAAPTTTPPAAPATAPIEAGTGTATELNDSVLEALRPTVIREAFAEHKLPEAAQEKLKDELAKMNFEQIRETIARTAGIWGAAQAANPAVLPGQGPRIAGVTDSAEKMQKALDAMIGGEASIDGVPAFRSVKEAYSAFTGRHPYGVGDEDFNRWLLAESVGGIPYHGGQRLTESLTSASWGEALGDSITRKLIREYENPEYQSWRKIVSDFANLTDFRSNKRIRVGGYDLLPTVAEAAAYAALTSPTDEEATYVPTKKGGLEDYTLEMAANDDLGALRKIPVNLARAAALTLYRAVWNTTIAANALIYDGVALFAAGHSNDTAATPLDEAGISVLRRKMMRQIKLGETNGFIGTRPKFLVVPPELYVAAYKLSQSQTAVVGAAESANTPNPYYGLQVIEVPTLTDVNDWYLIADPATIPTIEVGFYQGRQDPELLVQDQPFTGAVFTNDKITWKIRHIWGLTVLEYRGFQRATNV